jgi:cytochrome c553
MNAAALLSCLMSGLLAATLAAPAAAAEAAAPAKADPAKGQATAAGVCGACHTFDGSRGSPANPILQGQHPEYLAKQLAEFKAGKRDNAIMKGMAATLDEEGMKNVAAFYAGKSAKPGFAKNKALVGLGEKIYRGGVAERKVAACSGCHGPAGSGIPSQYPRLAGQHADYTEAQLLAFRGGLRKNSAQMTGVSAGLTDSEIKAVADYIAGLR